MINLYTQDNCTFCSIIKKNLGEWEIPYIEIDITNNPKAKSFLKERGHRTVPQLYYDDVNLNEGYNTQDLTKSILLDRMCNYE